MAWGSTGRLEEELHRQSHIDLDTDGSKQCKEEETYILYDSPVSSVQIQQLYMEISDQVRRSENQTNSNAGAKMEKLAES